MQVTSIVGKLKITNKSGKKNEIQEANIKFIESAWDVAKFFYALEKAFDNVTLFVKLGIEIMFYYGITFVGNAKSSSLLLNKCSNFLRWISFIGKNFFARADLLSSTPISWKYSLWTLQKVESISMSKYLFVTKFKARKIFSKRPTLIHFRNLW